MRETKHLGNTLGAVEVELKRGHVHHIKIVSVKRFSADEQAMGAPLLQYKTIKEISDKAPVKTLEFFLDGARKRYNADPVDGMAYLDAIIATYL